ncbi:hypothetical protein CVV65_07530 [Kyrpidia spormannii]|uniref:HTH cro/C1-type domain-containing protein n=1 Tax=Kyrpidia spormannii TaxID=2055160 RepID=A0A2K8N604_9BACL|nr:hypothetical protein CVV65_07530 [Kyrpidia spormannii]
MTHLTPEVVRIVRQFKGMTQAELGKTAGISQRMVAYIEAGACRITERMEPKLRQALGIDDQTIREIQKIYQRVTSDSN